MSHSPTRARSRPGRAPVTPAPRAGFDWRRIAYHTLVSRALDDVEESTNRNRASVPKEHVVLYQFSARGHDMAQAILGSLLTGTRDGVGAYYRSRPLLLALGLPLDDALGSPLGRAGGFSDGRDIGVVCNLPNREGAVVLPMSGDVGSQYTPAAGWAQAITYHRDTLGDSRFSNSISVALGGDGSVATNGFWAALTMATTLQLPMLFYIEDNNLGISVPGHMQTPGGDIARNLASFGNLHVLNGDGADPHHASELLQDAVLHVRAGRGPALVRLTVPRLSSHSGPDNQKGYRTEGDIAADALRDPLPRLREYLVPAYMSADEWRELEAEVAGDVAAALDAARARAIPDASRIAQHVFDGPEHLVEHRTVNFNLATNDIQVGAFANLLGRLADDAVKAFRLTGEGNHPNAHQRLLQTTVEARLGKNGRIGVVEVLQQILLHRRHVIDRLRHEAGEFLEARKTVEFKRVELGLTFGGVSNVSLNLAFGLNFNFTQLAAQANDVFGEVEQRAFQAAHFAFNPGSCNRQLTRLVNQTVNQVGTDPYRCLLTTRLGIWLCFRRDAGRGLRTGRNCLGNGRAFGQRCGLRPLTQTLDSLRHRVDGGLKFIQESRRCMLGAYSIFDPRFDQVSQLAQIHRPRHPGIALEGMEQAGNGVWRGNTERIGLPDVKLGRQVAQLIGGFFEEKRQ